MPVPVHVKMAFFEIKVDGRQSEEWGPSSDAFCEFFDAEEL